MTSPTANRAADGTTAAPTAPASPFVLAQVPGLEAVGADAVGFCGPDGCYPEPSATPAD
ncbi:hypothetical protein [Georgenia daeguensis]|uniref:hypothetical protein n=1 Tax=Georgenia daeguensis TaxID=908355 RepID=UPI0031EA2DB2